MLQSIFLSFCNWARTTSSPYNFSWLLNREDIYRKLIIPVQHHQNKQHQVPRDISLLWVPALHAVKVNHFSSSSMLKSSWRDGIIGRSRDGLYEPVLADSEREAVADLLQYLENVLWYPIKHKVCMLTLWQRGETDFFTGEPLRALSTLVFSDNVDLQRSASLTFAEITERGTSIISALPDDDSILKANNHSFSHVALRMGATHTIMPLLMFTFRCPRSR